jgi:hypothetical protein
VLTVLVWLGLRSGRLPQELAAGPSAVNLTSVLDAFTALAMVVVAGLILQNRPGNRLGWVVLLLGFILGISGFCRAYISLSVGGFGNALPGLVLAAWVSQVIWFALFTGLELLLLLYPTGTLLSRRWRWVAGVALLLTVCAFALLAVGTPIDVAGGQVDNPIGLIAFDRVEVLLSVLIVPFLITLILALVGVGMRFRRATGTERLQIKWLFYVAALSIIAQIVSLVTNRGDILASLVAMGLPVAIAIAILRYNLYDINVIIRKTLVYAVLTALLGLVYFGSVVLLQQLVGAVTGVEQSPLAIVVSTLVIAALFTPLRRRIQDWIDRRFFRKKYDAQRVLAQFALTARDETDLDALTVELARVVQETIQPEQVSVWLLGSERRS